MRTCPPEGLVSAPVSTMDVLSDVLRVIRLAGSVFFTARLYEPWAFASASGEELAELMIPEAECLTLFHIVAEGEFWLSREGQPPVHVRSGEAVIVPHADAHVMGSDPRLTPEPITPVLSGLPDEGVPEGIPHVDSGGEGRPCRLICGYLHCGQRFNPLLGALPRVLLVRRANGAVLVGPPTDDVGVGTGGPDARVLRPGEADWLETTLRFTMEEAEKRRSGGGAMLARLTEILFVEVVRTYMEQMPSGHSGWLAGVRDPEVGRALQLLHARPEQGWTVESLAREVGKSRSALAQRFVDLVGTPPMRYLSEWRMQLAKRLMRRPGLGTAEVASRVGYGSEAAFNRAFKRHVGEPPATWRSQQA